MGRLTLATDALLNTQIYDYDDNDNLIGLTDERGKLTSFTHDALNRVETRTNPALETISFTYDSRDNLKTTTDAKLQTITNHYDDLNRLIQVVTPDNTIDLDYDPAGNLIAANDDDSELSFTHDNLNRLETASTGPLGIQPPVTLTAG